jgi:hypothetical protein
MLYYSCVIEPQFGSPFIPSKVRYRCVIMPPTREKEKRVRNTASFDPPMPHAEHEEIHTPAIMLASPLEALVSTPVPAADEPVIALVGKRVLKPIIPASRTAPPPPPPLPTAARRPAAAAGLSQPPVPAIRVVSPSERHYETVVQRVLLRVLRLDASRVITRALPPYVCDKDSCNLSAFRLMLPNVLRQAIKIAVSHNLDYLHALDAHLPLHETIAGIACYERIKAHRSGETLVFLLDKCAMTTILLSIKYDIVNPTLSHTIATVYVTCVSIKESGTKLPFEAEEGGEEDTDLLHALRTHFHV